MSMNKVYSSQEISQMAKALFVEERSKKRLDGWFIIKESYANNQHKYAQLPVVEQKANLLRDSIDVLPLTIGENHIFAGSQSDCFARSYALINPGFEVESFSGYCDPTAVYNDIEPNEEFSRQRIDRVREADQKSPYVKALTAVYSEAETDTKEVAYFIEQVTGHIIPDMRPALKYGLNAIVRQLEKKIASEADSTKRSNFIAMKTTLEAAVLLANRYRNLALEQAQSATPKDKARLEAMAETLARVPAEGATSLGEAVQSFILLWQVMCMEQAPNPYAFSVGNADRFLEPYRALEGLDKESASALLKHLLVFFNVGDRSWAISQNVLISGRDLDGSDLTNLTSYALMDAYYDMNLPQPILSVKLHKNTPEEFYTELGKFFFTPGCLTPSLFNDDAMFAVLEKSGIAREDLPDYAVAGCQEPLIMGKDNGNTTNSWLNLGKILELSIGNGKSMLTGQQIHQVEKEYSAKELLENLRPIFYKNVEYYTQRMAKAADNATRALSNLPVPFLSCFMGGLESGIDMRDAAAQGTKYNASGCLIHGLAVVADSFVAVDRLLSERPADAERLVAALKTNFVADEELRQYMATAPKFGNNIPTVDREAAQVAQKVSTTVKAQKNYLGNPFRADWSTPSTHLLYGYWVAATPDGRRAREMLNYGVDPSSGDANAGLGFRLLSMFNLPYEEMNGGYASHFGVDPKFFSGKTLEEKGDQFSSRVIKPLFFNEHLPEGKVAPFYLYVNITTPETLKKVLAKPEVYAPSGVYIMRIHGTFVNFLDLSPAIQRDIIARLDLASTSV